MMTAMIPGLRYIPGYLDNAVHDTLLAAVDSGAWRDVGHRRMQVYGYSYELRKGGAYRVEDLPAWAHALAQRLQRDELMVDLADQMIVNDYTAGQGIPAHIDAPLFTDTIVSISLGSTCMMEFTTEAGAREEQFLEPMSALVIGGEARSQWKHAISAREHDLWSGRVWRRGRRVSLTFRKMCDPANA
jgi:alkylated DNA repair dioxygenase AlkB